MTDYEHNKERALHCAHMARHAGDERVRRFHKIARDTFLSRAVQTLKKEWQREEGEK